LIEISRELSSSFDADRTRLGKISSSVTKTETDMKARDVMVSPVIVVGENETVRDVARLLIAERISAVPVVDSAGKLVGIVTEADLMRRVESGTERPYYWWLPLLTGDQTIAADYVKSRAGKVKDVMTRDVKTAAPDTPLHEIADLFEESHIKRVPIVGKDGDLVGIVSRANIMQAVASARPKLAISLPDATIREKLLNELKRQRWAHVHKLNVTVTNGAVNLCGFVESETERQAVQVAAQSIPGVIAINDHLVREPALVARPSSR
jgi:CBS domain-containing protein